jgi:hypothetical protein
MLTCSSNAAKAIVAFSTVSIFRLVFLVLVSSVYRTERVNDTETEL